MYNRLVSFVIIYQKSHHKIQSFPQVCPGQMLNNSTLVSHDAHNEKTSFKFFLCFTCFAALVRQSWAVLECQSLKVTMVRTNQMTD